jgi:hypothetical protein
MTPENRNSPLLDNGSLTHVSVTTVIHELFEMVIPIQLAPSRVVGGDEKGSLESETVKYSHESNGLGPENDCAGGSQYQLQTADSSSR